MGEQQPRGFAFGIQYYGIVIKLARRAASLAVEDQRKKKRITNPLESAILLYTDAHPAAAVLAATQDMADICGISAIEGICIIGGSTFPPETHEAEREDMEWPRIAALWLPPVAPRCLRCRKWTAQPEQDLCERCDDVLARVSAARSDIPCPQPPTLP